MESMKQKFFRRRAAGNAGGVRGPERIRLPITAAGAEPLPVLMYHHMVPDGQDCNDMTMTPASSAPILETVLATGYTPVLPGNWRRGRAAGKAHPHHL